MGDIKRFVCTNGKATFCYGCYTMDEDVDGEYVLHEDYEQLQKERDELLEKLDKAEVNYWCAKTEADGLLRERDELYAALNDLLNDCINFDGGKLSDCELTAAFQVLTAHRGRCGLATERIT